VLYVSKLWADCGTRNEGNVLKWLKMVNYVLGKAEVRKEKGLYEKGRRMRLEMLAYLEVWHNKKIDINV
jgi:hypothetical protein